MSPTSRPNLGGLFNGTTPPARSSSIAAALGTPEAAGESTAPASGSARAKRSSAAGKAGPPPVGAPVPPLGSTPFGSTSDASGQWAALQWLDPVRVLGFYFDVVQTMFDVQRRLTMGVASAVTAPVRRAGVWR
jgi:hypothetical protein